MNPKPDYLRKHFATLADKNIRNALAHRLRQDFPRLGGDRILDLCATMILEVVADHLRPLEHVRHGQVIWMAVSIDDPPAKGKRLAQTRLVPVLLNLSTPADIDAILNRESPSARLLAKAIRLCEEAYVQGGLLGNTDLAELLQHTDSRIAGLLAAHERNEKTVVPRRATLHDMGSGLTHKRIICWKRYAEGKSQDEVARETHHSLAAVDRYLGDFDRVRHCLEQGLTPDEIATILRHGRRLIDQYIAIDKELKAERETPPAPPEGPARG